MADEEAPDVELTLEEKTELAVKITLKQLIIAAAMILVMLVVFVVGLLVLVNAHKATSSLVAKKPENRIESFATKIESAQGKVELQYYEHLSRMDDASIFKVNEEFKIIYQLSEQSEEDYVAFIKLYQQIAYDSASRVKGSGEWFYYYEKNVGRAVQQAEKIQRQLNTYLHRE
ncbi:MAG: phosphate uptake regulator [Oceanicoccus sp.]|jgi:phosphate uptake regulator